MNEGNNFIGKCFVILVITIFVLKLFGIINISWLTTLIILWSPFIFAMAITLILIVFAAIACLINVTRALASLRNGS